MRVQNRDALKAFLTDAGPLIARVRHAEQTQGSPSKSLRPTSPALANLVAYRLDLEP